MKKSSKLWLIGGLVAVVALVGGFFAIKSIIETQPQDLGSELEYIGKSEYGCWAPLCDSPPGAIYFFATDLTQDQLKGYFKKASYVHYPNVGGGGSGHYNYDYLHFKPTFSKEEFVISYYDNTATVLDLKNLRKTGNEHVVSIDSSFYDTARESLE